MSECSRNDLFQTGTITTPRSSARRSAPSCATPCLPKRSPIPIEYCSIFMSRLSVSRPRSSAPRAGCSALDPGGAAPREGAHLLEGRHRRVAGERRDERAVRPPEPHRLLGRLSGQEAVEEPGGEAVAPADPIEDVEIADGRGERGAVDPRSEE